MGGSSAVNVTALICASLTRTVQVRRIAQRTPKVIGDGDRTGDSILIRYSGAPDLDRVVAAFSPTLRVGKGLMIAIVRQQ